MNQFMGRLRVKREITTTFLSGTDPVASAATMTDEQFEKNLDFICSDIPFRNRQENQSLSMFLYAGCSRFDRWFPPSPYVVPAQQRARFSKFLSALQRCELGVRENCAVFEIHEIKDALFAAFDELPLGAIDTRKLSELQQRVSKVAAPSGPMKLEEFCVQKEEVDAILEGLLDGSPLCQYNLRHLPN